LGKLIDAGPRRSSAVWREANPTSDQWDAGRRAPAAR
jgi:hypothetical protein